MLVDLRAAASLSLIAWTTIVLPARAVDPSRPIIVTAGPSQAPHAMPSGDTCGSSLSPVPLPTSLGMRWRIRLPDEPMGPALVDAEGRIFVATRQGDVRQLSRAGTLLWEATTGEDIVAPPVLSNGGDRIVLTSSTRLLLWSATGRPLVDRRLSSNQSVTARPLPLGDETLLIAIGQDVLHVDRHGRPLAAASLPEPPYALLANQRRIVIIGRGGGVYEWVDPAPVREVTGLGGRPTGGAFLDEARLLAIVDGQRLVEVDLDRRVRHTGLEAPLRGPLASTHAETIALSADGNLLAVDRDGATEVRGSAFRSTAGGSAPEPGTASLMVDHAGRAVLTDSQRGLATITPTGAVRWLDPPPCRGLAHASPHASGAVVITCRDGTVALLAARSLQPSENMD